MKSSRNFAVIPAVVLAATVSLTGCVEFNRVPPGQSAALARAKKPELVALPPVSVQEQELQQQLPPSQIQPKSQPQPGSEIRPVALTMTTRKPMPMPAPEPALPDNKGLQAADSFMVGNLCMEQGKYPEAASAYEKTVRLNPRFAEAWNKLAVAYQNIGEDQKALAAFRKYKSLSLQ